ncbi:MAG: helix-turn-helix transcriptional regulator [Pseudolabrys sp.]
MTQEELAHRARIHRTYMSSVERAQRNIAIDNIERIAAGLGVRPKELLSDDR